MSWLQKGGTCEGRGCCPGLGRHRRRRSRIGEPQPHAPPGPPAPWILLRSRTSRSRGTRWSSPRERRAHHERRRHPEPPPVPRTSRADSGATVEEPLTDQRDTISSPTPAPDTFAGTIYAIFRDHPVLTIDTAARLLGVTARHTTTILSRLRRHKTYRQPRTDGRKRNVPFATLHHRSGRHSGDLSPGQMS